MTIDSLIAVADQTRPRALATARQIVLWCRARELAAWTAAEAPHDLHPALVVALGGDRTMMRTARRYPNALLLGINFGRVGFLSTVEHREWQTALGRVLAGDFVKREGPTLAATLCPSGQSFTGAINDFVLRAPRGVAEVELYLDTHFVNVYPGDGLIVSTPQGATAYAMNAGGPILAPGVRGLVVVPISSGPAVDRGLVAPESARLDLLLRGRYPVELTLDGESVATVHPGEEVTIQAGESTFRSVVFPEHNYFAALRQKLNYTIRPHYRPLRGSGRDSADP
ncbi:MAG: NAD(+)/NADH kinase [Chloroflexi bacterium]|nr:NAD(+)/NADH kinase [Chloroflexota bacterium]